MALSLSFSSVICQKHFENLLSQVVLLFQSNAKHRKKVLKKFNTFNMEPSAKKTFFQKCQQLINKQFRNCHFIDIQKLSTFVKHASFEVASNLTVFSTWVL